MGGITTLRRIQGGVETVLGTEVDATAMWRFEGVLEDLQKTVVAKEDVGMIPQYGRVYIPSVGGRMKMAGPATFEQLLYVLLGGVDGTITGVRDATGPYVYTFVFPTTAVKVPKTYTIEGGNNQQEEQMTGAFVESFTLKGGADEALMLEAIWRGKQVAKGTFTGALVPTAVSDVLFNKGALYIEAVAGTIGTTLKSSTLIDMSLKVDTGFQPLQAADGELSYAAVKQVAPKITLDATFEHNATAVAISDNWRLGVGNLVQLKFVGPAAAVAGSTYTYKTLILNAAFKWTDVKPLGSKNGNDILQVSGYAYMEIAPTPDLFANMVLVNDLSAPV